MDWKNVVGTVAPWIGTALGGPLGGAAVEAVANALGLSEKTEAAVKSALAGTTPEMMLALKQADNEFALKMQEVGFTNSKDMERLSVDDRDSARKREMTVKDNTPRNLAYLITGGYFLVVGLLMMGVIPTEGKDMLYLMLGTLGTAWTGCIAYYFGSTKGSQTKTDLLARSQPVKD
jgi:hypothetical protein